MKSVSLPDRVCDDLAKVAEELTLMAKKPISQSMAVDLLIEVYHAHLSNRCALDLFSQQLQRADIMPPNEFDAYWDGPNEPMPSKAKKGKASAKR